MNSHRIFVIWITPLFFESLRLLLRNPDIQWIGSAHNSEKEFNLIQRLNPDTILFEEEENGQIPTNLIDLMEGSTRDMRIFRISLADNDLKIYYREKRTVMQADDLLNLIREGE